jgi:hypothetical protein
MFLSPDTHFKLVRNSLSCWQARQATPMHFSVGNIALLLVAGILAGAINAVAGIASGLVLAAFQSPTTSKSL